jgi:hypothetical protein
MKSKKREKCKLEDILKSLKIQYEIFYKQINNNVYSSNFILIQKKKHF